MAKTHMHAAGICDCCDAPDNEEVIMANDTATEPAEAQVAEPVSAELALAIREERATAVQPHTTLPTAREWEATLAVARQIAATPFVPESYRGQPEAVVAAILTGREMGIGPMQSLRDIHMIDGRPAFAAQLMLSRMREGGVVLLESTSTATGASITAKRTDTGEVGTFEFTKADAEAAKLLGKKNWQAWPSDMYWARAVGRMARRFGSDLLGGLVYTKEELEDIDAGYGDQYEGVQGSGYEASSFDPARQLLPKAPRGTSAEVSAQLWGQQQGIAADLDWSAILEEAALACMGPKAEWGEGGGAEFMARWANTITRLLELADESPLYHPDLGLQKGEEADAMIVAAFEFGFAVTPSLPLPVVSEGEVIDADGETAPDDDVPFGEEAGDGN